ncbi:MAG: hypothetical protein PHN82_02225 [bacterium]|nr:hypothetical protein [bacterium]
MRPLLPVAAFTGIAASAALALVLPTEFMRAEDGTFIDLLPVFRAAAARPPLLYYCDDPHLTCRGLEIAARGIHEAMQGR